MDSLEVGGVKPGQTVYGRPVVLAAGGTSEQIVSFSVPGGHARPVFTAASRAVPQLVNAPSWAPDGRSFVVSAGNPEDPDEARVVIVSYPSGRRITVRDRLLEAPGSIVFSPDRRYLLVVRAGTHRDGLYAYDLRQRRRIWLLAGHVDDGPTLSWSRDGRRIAFARAGRRGGIAVLDLVSRSVKLLTSDGTDPAWSPDGTEIAFASTHGGLGRSCNEEYCTSNAEVDVVQRDGSGRRRLTKTRISETKPSWSPDGRWIVALASNNEYLGTHGLVTVAAQASCHRTLVAIASQKDYDLGSNAWRPTRGAIPSERLCRA